MPYVLISPVTAESFNRGLCRLMRPSHLRDESYVTDLYCPMHTHPTNGWMALELPDVETVPIHIEATGEELAAVLQIFVDDAALTIEEANNITSAISFVAGQEVRIADFIPSGWAPYVLTHDQMIEGGWFNALNP